MNIINENMYIVVVSGGAWDDAPKYNRAGVAGVYTTLDEAKSKLQAIADEWKDSIDAEGTDRYWLMPLMEEYYFGKEVA